MDSGVNDQGPSNCYDQSTPWYNRLIIKPARRCSNRNNPTTASSFRHFRLGGLQAVRHAHPRLGYITHKLSRQHPNIWLTRLWVSYANHLRAQSVGIKQLVRTPTRQADAYSSRANHVARQVSPESDHQLPRQSRDFHITGFTCTTYAILRSVPCSQQGAK
jgi:hypothetical protein